MLGWQLGGGVNVFFFLATHKNEETSSIIEHLLSVLCLMPCTLASQIFFFHMPLADYQLRQQMASAPVA